MADVSDERRHLVSRLVWRLRGRLARWLAGPFLEARYDHANNAVKAGHKPAKFHVSDWWSGQTLVLVQAARDMQRGRPHTPTTEDRFRVLQCEAEAADSGSPRAEGIG